MTTATATRQLLRARIANGSIVNSANAPVPLRWQNEDVDSTGSSVLADPPAPFVFTEFTTGNGSIVSFGGGAGGNRFRTPFDLAAYVFVPKNDFTQTRDGLQQAEAIAEQIATLFRSYRSGDVSCFDVSVQPGGDGATLKPPGIDSEVGNYFYACAYVAGSFDQIG